MASESVCLRLTPAALTSISYRCAQPIEPEAATPIIIAPFGTLGCASAACTAKPITAMVPIGV
jgi:hypothetical protein